MISLGDFKLDSKSLNIDGSNNNIVTTSSINTGNIKNNGFKNVDFSNKTATEFVTLDLDDIISSENKKSEMDLDFLKERAQENASKILGRMSNNNLSDLDALSKLSSEQLDLLLGEYNNYKDNIDLELKKDNEKSKAAMLNMSKRSVEEYIELLGFAKDMKTEEYQKYIYNDVENMSYEELVGFYNEYMYSYDRLNNFPTNEDIENWKKYSNPSNILKLLEYSKRFEEVEGVSLTTVNAASYQELFPSLNSDLIECYSLMSESEKKLFMFYSDKYGNEKTLDYLNEMLPSWRQRVAYENVSNRINKLTFADEDEIKEYDIMLRMEMDIPLDKRNDMSLPIYRTPLEYRKFYEMEMKLPVDQRFSRLIDPDEYEAKYNEAYEKASDELYKQYETGLVRNDLSNLFNVSSSGLNDGINTFFDGIGKTFATNGELTISDYEKLMYMSYLESNSYGLTDYYNISSAVGNMLPITTAGVLMGFVSPAYSSKIAQGLMFTSAYGNTSNQMMYQGYSPKLSIFYGLASASVETALESFGGVFGVSDDIGKSVLVNLGKEGIEEAVQSAVQLGVIDSIMLGEEINLDKITSEMKESFYSGVIVAGILNSYSSSLVNTINFVQNGNTFSLTNADFENIIKLKESNNISYEESFSTYIQHLTQNDYSVLRDLKNFNLEKFYTENQNGGIIIITPNQTLGAQTADNGAGEHGDRVNDIYNLIYKNFKPIESAWQYDSRNENNIVIQLCTGCESVVWLPDNMNKYQLDVLKYFNTEIASIKNKTNVSGFMITDREMDYNKSFHMSCNDLSGAIEAGTKRLNNNIKGSDIVLQLSTLDSINFSQQNKIDSQASKGESSGVYVRNLDINTKNRINTFREQLNSYGNNEIVVDFLCLALEDSYKRGNNDIDSFINKIHQSGIRFELGSTGTGSKSWGSGIVTIDPVNIANNDYICILHEIGHQFNNKVNNRRPPSNWMNTMQLMQQVGNYSKNSVLNDVFIRRNVRYGEAVNLLDGLLKSEGFNERLDYYNYLNDKYSNVGIFQKNNAKKELRNMKVSEDVIKRWASGKISASDLANEIIKARTSSLELMSSFKSGDITLCDIVDGVYMGKAEDSYGNPISGHGEQYYKFNPAEDSYDEIMANYIALKMRNDTQTINNLEKVFGNGFIQTLDSEYNKLVR